MQRTMMVYSCVYIIYITDPLRTYMFNAHIHVFNSNVCVCMCVTQVPEAADNEGLLLTDAVLQNDVQLSALIHGLKDDNSTGFQVCVCV